MHLHRAAYAERYARECFLDVCLEGLGSPYFPAKGLCGQDMYLVD